MKYCLLSELKTRLNITSSDADAELNRYIEAVSAMADQHCRRVLGYSETVVDEFAAAAREVVLSRFPVEVVSMIQRRDDARSAWETVSTTWDLPRDGRAGVLRFTDSPPGVEGQLARVTYAGGYILPENTAQSWQYALPEDLQHAVIEQVSYMWSNRHNLRLADQSGAGPAATRIADRVWLPLAEQMLEPYRRYNL